MQLILFKYKEENHFNDFRTIEIDGELWFVATDVAEILGYKKPLNAVMQHCKTKGTLKQGVPTAGGIQQMTLINEANVYRLIIKSQLPSAEKFEEWLFEKVIPSIRKTGHYTVGINRMERPNFIQRYFENFKNVDRGYFSVITELYTRLYAQLEHEGYQIPNKAIDGKEMRPDVSVGKCFASFISKYCPDMESDFKMYNHEFHDGSSFPARQYPIKYIHIFIRYVDEVWIPKYAENYFKKRDTKALEYLPKLLQAS